MVALLVAEGASDQPTAAEECLALLHHESPKIRHSAWWGLPLASLWHVETSLRALLERPEWDFASATALDIPAFEGYPCRRISALH